MRNLLFVIAAISLLFVACNKENLSGDELLIMEIQESTEKISIDQTELPELVKEDCNRKYFETFIDEVSLVETKGYEITMDSKEPAYFTLDGRKLEWSEKKGKKKMKKKGKDKDKEYCLAKFVESADLPQTIQDYMTNNHPNVILTGGKYFYEGFYLIGTDTKDILVFDDNGAYLKTIDLFSCDDDKDGWDLEISVQDLPTDAQSYIATNYPSHTIDAAFKKDGEFFVYLFDGSTKLLVGFDSVGGFMFVK